MRKQAFAVRRFLQSSAVVVAASLTACETASATGFFINQQSVKGLARVDAGNSAAADDLGTIFFNPAGLIQLFETAGRAWEPTDFRVSVGSHLIVPRSKQQNTGSTAASPGTLGAFAPYTGGDTRNPTDPTPVPNFYIAKKLANGRAAVGFAANVPFGLKTESHPAWYGRYDAIEASLRTWNLSVVGAYKIDSNLSIGGGINAQYARTTLTSAIPDPLDPGGPTAATDGRIATVGHDWTPGFNIGVMYNLRADGKTRIGAHYRSGMKHDIKGESAITGLTGPLAAFNGIVGARADLHLPAIATIGIYHEVNPRLVLLGELEWYDWSKFNEVRIIFEDGRPEGVRSTNYRDAYGVAVGAEYRMWSELTVRGGVHYDTTPTRDGFRDTTVPDAERLWLGLGGTYRWTKHFSTDFAFNHVFFRDTDIALTRTFFDGTPLATATRINGSVKSVVNTFSIDFRLAF